MYDIIIKNGLVVDGVLSPGFVADVCVKDGIVAEIGGGGDSALEIIDATGLVVAPGFVDSHTHSDKSAFFGSDAYNYLEQGVTLQIAGQCGSSPAPFGGREDMTISWGTGFGPDEAKQAAEWAMTPESFMRRAKEVAHGTNLAFLIGHGALRNSAMGYADTKATPEAMAHMEDLIRRAMECGFFGYSSGLSYAPSAYGDTAELTRLAEVMAPYGGVYATHMRSEGDKGVEGVVEAIEIAERAGVTLVISHLKTVGKANEGNSVKYFELIEAAVRRGVSVYADQYPFTASSAPLSSQIPVKYHVGGVKALLERLADASTRSEIWQAIQARSNNFESSLYTAGPSGILVVGAPKSPDYIGKTIAALAEEQNKSPFDAFCDLLLQNDGQGAGIYFSQNESDMMRILPHPRVMGGSDWSDISVRQNPEHVAGGHPRGMATFPRRLQLLRDHKLLSLEEAVQSITSRTAIAHGIKDHGVLKTGKAANITVFDHKTIGAAADFLHPFRRNTGIHSVIVNGQTAVRSGVATGVRAGVLVSR